MRRVPSRSVPLLAAYALVALGYGCLISRQARYGLEYDESHNLTVVKDLAGGDGHSTTWVSYRSFKEFDPAPSTVPALIIPGALLWALSDGTVWIARLVPLAYFLLYLGALGWLFTSIAGR